jgi:tetratricopeptide (TPR) repeat protein
MLDLSSAYSEIKQLRSRGDCDAALAILRTQPPAGDRDAFEGVVCLFVCGDMENVLNVCRAHPWKAEWAILIVGALSESLLNGDASRALTLARKAASAPGMPYDAAAIFLLLLQKNDLIEEADAYIRQHLRGVPAGETFLLTIMAEITLQTGNWRDAYRNACAVLSADPDDYRALIVKSIAAFHIGNVHESLGCALAARMLHAGSPPAILQIMRCHNRLGNHYAALAAIDTLADDKTTNSPELRVELGRAYEGLGDVDRAAAEYRAALASESGAVAAVRALVGIHTLRGDTAELKALAATYAGEIQNDLACLSTLGIAALNRGDLDEASRLFKETAALAERGGEPLRELPWPIPEARIRHDFEQLELLARRGKLGTAGADALALLGRYCARGGGPDATFAPAAAEAQALKKALTTTFYVSEPAFSGPALGEKDYAAIEKQYLADRVVVIDNFLSPHALDALRRYCEEATIWKQNYRRGYLGAALAQGFSPRVLLAIAYELKQALPKVIGAAPLMQAWAYKYDQRLQGINLHADFADINVNFWITPDEACEDPASGGMVVYDQPVPGNWTFHEYNNAADKLAVYLRLHKASAKKVPHRANRCVLFDSKLIHITDEMRFKPGYENRRVNVTLLYGEGRGS